MATLVDWGGKKLDATAQLQAFERFECEESLAVFLEHAWHLFDPSPYKAGWVIDALADHLEAVVDGEVRRLMIHIPPRCSKSSICSVAFPAWVWLQPFNGPTSGPAVPIVSGSYSFKLSVRDAIKCRRLIKSKWYQDHWGQRVAIAPDNDQKIRFGNRAGGERLVISVDGGVTGEGGNIVIIDDPNNAKEVLSEAIVETTNEDWWDGTMSTRLNDPRTGAYIVIQQRLGENDLSGHIMRKSEWPEWTHLCLPMEYESRRSFVTSIGWKDPRDADGELLWPARFGHSEVASLKSNLGSWRAAGQLQQRPEPQGGGIIKRAHWQLWPPGGEELDDRGQPVKPAAYPPMDYILACLDSAYTTDTMNDPSALTIWGVFSGETVAKDIRYGNGLQSHRVYGEAAARVMLMYAWSGRKELHELVAHVARLCQRKAPGLAVDKLLIEAKASGISVAQEMRRLFAFEGFGIQLYDPGRVDKVARLYSVQNIFEENTVFAPDRSWAEEVIAQCGTFPNGQHDDLVDTCFTSTTLIRMADGSQKPIVDVVVGDRVATPQGPCRVLWSGQTGSDEIWRLQAGACVLEGTAGHPVYADGQWIALGKLYPNAILTSWHGKRPPASQARAFISRVINTIAIRNRSTRRTADIFPAPGSSSTARCGRSIMGLFQRAIRSITGMAIRPTMRLATSNACLVPNIATGTTMAMLRAENPTSSSPISLVYGQRPQPGTAAKLDGSGTASMPPSRYGGLVTLLRSARSYLLSCPAFGALKLLRPVTSEPGSAQSRVEAPKAAIVVVSEVRRTRTTALVYNLTIEHCEMFYANDLLVHNCSMALRHLRDIGMLSRPAERMADLDEGLNVLSRRTHAPLYPG